MQPTTREMQAMAAGAGQISLDDLRNGHVGAVNGGGGVHDDFLDQMFGSLPPSAWHDLAAGTKPDDGAQGEGMQQFGGPYDESVMLASRLRQHQISGGNPGGGAAAAKQMVLQQLADLRQGHQHHMMLQGMGRSPSVGGGDGGMLLPLTLGNGGSGGDVQALLKAAAANSAGGDAGVYGGFSGSLQQQQHFQPHPQSNLTPTPVFYLSHFNVRFLLIDHSQLRRERIAERMKALQELVPNANKADKASMLDEIIDYVKFLQLQVLSMSRLGGAAAVAPLVADMSSEGRGGGPAAGSEGLTVTEQQVAKLMEDDMGAAMQYLQGKGLCLMPISLASAISSTTCQLRPPAAAAGPPFTAAQHQLNAAMRGMNGASDGAAHMPPSPSMSVLTAQSAMANGACVDGNPKDAASVSKP
ncbi:hypothetical protein ACQ4PT_070660 [Festuca glaucescens]